MKTTVDIVYTYWRQWEVTNKVNLTVESEGEEKWLHTSRGARSSRRLSWKVSKTWTSGGKTKHADLRSSKLSVLWEKHGSSKDSLGLQGSSVWCSFAAIYLQNSFVFVFSYRRMEQNMSVFEQLQTCLLAWTAKREDRGEGRGVNGWRGFFFFFFSSYSSSCFRSVCLTDRMVGPSI